MTTNLTREPPELSLPRPVDLDAAQLPQSSKLAAVVAAVALGALVAYPFGRGLALGAVAGWIMFVVLVPVLSARVEGRRKATDRTVTILVSSAFVVALLPLLSLLYTVISRGAPAFAGTFFTESMRNVSGEGGGIYHAVWGTLLVTGAAAVISVPIGLMTAIYLVEYGKGSLAHWIRFLVDVMTGIPSIVAGLFAYALFALFFGEGIRMGLMGAVALSVLMIPIVVRSSEEMLKLVPNELREASYALGVPKWRTITKIVLPTALAGIVTGVTLAIARVVGETAPLLITCGITDSLNTSIFGERIMTLPVYAYTQYATPGIAVEASQERAWGAALVLLILVMALNFVARLISKIFSPKTKA